MHCAVVNFKSKVNLSHMHAVVVQQGLHLWTIWLPVVHHVDLLRPHSLVIGDAVLFQVVSSDCRHCLPDQLVLLVHFLIQVAHN